MAFMPEKQTTSIATHTNDDIFVREKSLCDDLIGKLSFTEMAYFQITGKLASAAEVKMVDACLVTLMEHGLTPSALSSRLIYSSAPEAIQAAVAAGIMGVGSTFAGTMEGCASLIERILTSDVKMETEAATIAAEFRASKRPLPGFGHHMHKPDDPCSIRLLAIAEEVGVRENGLRLSPHYPRQLTISMGNTSQLMPLVQLLLASATVVFLLRLCEVSR